METYYLLPGWQLTLDPSSKKPALQVQLALLWRVL